MDAHVLNLDKPRKLKFGFKALKTIREKYGEKKDLTAIMDVNADEIPYFAWVGLQWEDETLTLEQAENLIEDAIPDTYTVLDVISIIVKAIEAQIGVKKKAKTKKKTPSRTTVRSRSK